ncbi:MAG: hypothetical protein K6A41_08185, partial [Bacteroidales bacterium]|nr:hypothetical protein [Bacteroidales bacterium]
MMKTCLDYLRHLKGFYLVCLCFFGVFGISSCKKAPDGVLYDTVVLPDYASVTSLGEWNEDTHDTLVVGTKDGFLYYFCTKNNQFGQRRDSVGDNHSVHVAKRYNSDILFVGVSDEGLKRYDTRDMRKEPRRYRLPGKDYQYAVYKILIDGDTILCATSQGLAMLDLSSDCDSLSLLYPKNVRDDYKATDVRFLDKNRDKLEVVFSSTVMLFHKGKYDTVLSKRVEPTVFSRFNEVKIGDRKYMFEPEDYNIIIASKSEYRGVPHDFVSVFYDSSIQGNDNGRFIAIAEDNINNSFVFNKEVYIGNRDSVTLNRKWTKTVSKIPYRIVDMCFVGDTCFLLAKKGRDGVVYYGDSHKVSPWDFKLGYTPRVRCMWYDSDWGKFYFALGSGLLIYNPHTGEQVTMLDSIPIQCFAKRNNALYMGTMRYGVIVLDESNRCIDTVKPGCNIQDVAVNKNSLYVLTNDSIFRYDNSKQHSLKHSSPLPFGITHLYADEDKLMGCTDNGLLFELDKDACKGLNEKLVGRVNPNAVCLGIDDVIGTDKGLFYLSNDDAMSVITKDSSLSTQKLVLIIVVAVVAFLLLIGWLIYRYIVLKRESKRELEARLSTEQEKLEEKLKQSEDSKGELEARLSTEQGKWEEKLKQSEDSKRELEARLSTEQEKLEEKLKQSEDSKRELEARLSTEQGKWEEKLKQSEDSKRELEARLSTEQGKWEEKLKQSEDSKRELEARLSTEQGKWEEKLKQSEDSKRELEARLSTEQEKLEEKLKQSEDSKRELEARLSTEREKWEVERKESEDKLKRDFEKLKIEFQFNPSLVNYERFKSVSGEDWVSKNIRDYGLIRDALLDEILNKKNDG